jgi:hypothetical protein
LPLESLEPPLESSRCLGDPVGTGVELVPVVGAGEALGGEAAGGVIGAGALGVVIVGAM